TARVPYAAREIVSTSREKIFLRHGCTRMCATFLIVRSVALVFFQDAAQLRNCPFVKIDAQVDFGRIPAVDDAYPGGALRAVASVRHLTARITTAFQGPQQSLFERRLGLLEKTADDALDGLRTGQAVAVGGVVRTYGVAGPFPDTGAGVRHDIGLAVDDTDLPVVEIRVVGFEHAHDAARRVTLLEQVENHRIDMTQIVRL